MKTCSKCKRELDEDQFHKSNRYVDGHISQCRDCRKSNRDAYLATHPMCSICGAHPHANGHPYCRTCVNESKSRSANGQVRQRPDKFRKCTRCKERDRVIGKRLCLVCEETCPKCRQYPRALGSVWCLHCLRPYQKARRQLNGGRWWKELTPEQREKRRRRSAVWNMISRGKIIPKPCEVCGNLKTEGHHHLGYARKNTYDLRWLCRLHHRALEKWEKSVLTKDGTRLDGRSVTVVGTST